VRFIGPDDLGPHCYWLDGTEDNGILYTCRAGHIDIAHVRKAADWTGFLAALTLECLQEGRTAFQFKLREPSRYFVELTYPQGWDALPADEKERVAREVSRQLGQYLAYTAMTWHEILTWFGFKPKGYRSEFPSAFSWEDNYSNLLGTIWRQQPSSNRTRVQRGYDIAVAGASRFPRGPAGGRGEAGGRERPKRLVLQLAVLHRHSQETLRYRPGGRRGHALPCALRDRL
jgi:hypothetical protein